MYKLARPIDLRVGDFIIDHDGCYQELTKIEGNFDKITFTIGGKKETVSISNIDISYRVAKDHVVYEKPNYDLSWIERSIKTLLHSDSELSRIKNEALTKIGFTFSEEYDLDDVLNELGYAKMVMIS